MVTRHLVIIGHVKNVFYRAWFAEQATALGINGWVRNRADGSVEAMVQGAAEAVDAIVARAHEGSPPSRVDGVEVSEGPTGVLDGFELRETA